MKTNLAKSLTLIVAGIVIILTLIGLRSANTQPSTAAIESIAPEILFNGYSEGITTTVFNSLGEINYTLQAQRQVLLLDDSSELDHPIINLYQSGLPSWQLTANSGKIEGKESGDNSNTIYLSGEVEVLSQDSQGQDMQLLTEYLHVNPQAETLDTDTQVQLIIPNLTQTAIGMFADLGQEVFNFHRQTRGSYVTQTP